MVEKKEEIYGIAHMLRDYAKGQHYAILSFSDIEEYLFSVGLSITDAQLYPTLKEMLDAGWLTMIDFHRRVIYFHDHAGRRAA